MTRAHIVAFVISGAFALVVARADTTNANSDETSAQQAVRLLTWQYKAKLDGTLSPADWPQKLRKPDKWTWVVDMDTSQLPGGYPEQIVVAAGSRGGDTGKAVEAAGPSAVPPGADAQSAPPATQQGAQPGVPKVDLSTGKDTYGRVLGISVTDIGGTYRFGSQIPITVRITNCTPAKAEHPRAQLFPHLTVWVKLNQTLTTDKIKLPVENRIGINPGETFEQSVDLTLVSPFSAPGKYDVSIGHKNGKIEDIGDWTGALRSRPQSIEIKKF